MNPSNDKRSHVRYNNPGSIAVEARELPGFRLTPQDISAGGFQAVLARKPEMGAEFACSIFFNEKRLEEVRAKPVWVSPNKSNPPTWAVGFELVMAEAKRGALEGRLRDSLGGGR